MEQEPFDPSEFARIAQHVSWVREVSAVSQTGSTNDDALARARDGAPEGTVVVADAQSAGRGRLDRAWVAPAGTSLHVSWILRPTIDRDRRPLYTLATAVAAARAIEETGVNAGVKWPNDLITPNGKLGGILAEMSGDAVVVGLGVNVRQDSFPDDIPGTSLLIERARPIGRAELLERILARFEPFLADPSVCLDEYRALCLTIGREVAVERKGLAPIKGRAEAVGDRGELIVSGEPVIAGDVVHVR